MNGAICTNLQVAVFYEEIWLETHSWSQIGKASTYYFNSYGPFGLCYMLLMCEAITPAFIEMVENA